MNRKAVNQTRNTTLAETVEMADSFLTRLMGLMGRSTLDEGYGLWILPCKDIHSFFMRFEFDAVFMSKEGKVVHLVERMRPWRMTRFVTKSQAVLELPSGAIAQSQTELGDTVVLETVTESDR